MPLMRLIFFAQAAQLGSIEVQLQEIALTARVRNARNALTGCLTAIDGTFIQCIEGARREVNAALQRIIHDGRIQGLTVVTFRETEARMFGDWSLEIIRPQQMHGLIERFLSSYRFEPERLSERTFEVILERLAQLHDGLGDDSLEVEFGNDPCMDSPVSYSAMATA